MSPGQPPPSYPLASVDRALQLLLLLHCRGELRVGEAAAELAVAPSSAHRLLTMLVFRELATKDRRHVYRPGPALTAMSRPAAPETDLPAVARPHLHGLAEACGESVHLVVLEGTGARFLDSVEGRHALRVATRAGLVLPAHLTSGGKALLAELDGADLAALYPRGLRLTPGASSVDLVSLRRELASVRRRGYALNMEETEQGVCAVGVAVRRHDGRAVAAVSISAPRVRVSRRNLTDLVAPLTKVCEAIAAAL